MKIPTPQPWLNQPWLKNLRAKNRMKRKVNRLKMREYRIQSYLMGMCLKRAFTKVTGVKAEFLTKLKNPRK